MPENPNKPATEYTAQSSLLQEEKERGLVCNALLSSLHNLKNYAEPDATNSPAAEPNQGSLRQLMGMAVHSAVGDLLYQHDMDYKQIEKHMQNFFNNPEAMELIARTSQTAERIASKKNFSQVDKERSSQVDIKKITKLMATFRDSFSRQEGSNIETDPNARPGLSAFIEAVVTMQHHGMENASRSAGVGKEVALQVSREARNRLFEFCKDVYPDNGVSPLENLLLEKKVNFTLKNTSGTKTPVNESMLDFLYRDYTAVKAESDGKGLGSFAEFRRYVADSLMPKASAGRDFIYENKKNQEVQKAFRESGALTICDVRPYCILPHNNRKVVLPTYALLLMLSDPKVPEQKLANLKAAYDKLIDQTKEKEHKPQYLRFKTNTTAYNNLARRNRQSIKNAQGSELGNMLGYRQPVPLKSGTGAKRIMRTERMPEELSRDSSTKKAMPFKRRLSDSSTLTAKSNQYRVSESARHTKPEASVRILGKDSVAFSAKGHQDPDLEKSSPLKSNQYRVSESARHTKPEASVRILGKDSVAFSAARGSKAPDTSEVSPKAMTQLHNVPKLPIKQEGSTTEQHESWAKHIQNPIGSQKNEGKQSR